MSSSQYTFLITHSSARISSRDAQRTLTAETLPRGAASQKSWRHHSPHPWTNQEMGRTIVSPEPIFLLCGGVCPLRQRQNRLSPPAHVGHLPLDGAKRFSRRMGRAWQHASPSRVVGEKGWHAARRWPFLLPWCRFAPETNKGAGLYVFFGH